MRKMIDPLNTWKIQTAIQEQLDEAYVKDGRDDKSHPMHSLYTGLFGKPKEDNKEGAAIVEDGNSG